MRSSYAIVALVSIPGMALAHMLPDDRSLAEQTAHQFTAAHHLPLVVVAVWLAVLGFRALRRRRPATRHATNGRNHRKQE
jgi:hypothetical protein